MEKPTEDTYVTELVSVVKEIGTPLEFDAEFNIKTPSGKPDITLYYKNSVVAVIEVKRPKVSLSDPDLNEQALRYAEWHRENRQVYFYGIHNMRYLKLLRYVEAQKKTLPDFMGRERARWIPVSEFPFKVMPWVKTIADYKEISTTKNARRNVEDFLLKFREILEGKTLDLSKDVISTVREYIEEGARRSLSQIAYLYKYGQEKRDIQGLVDSWRNERGFKKPQTDRQLRDLLLFMLKEQLYTFSMKILFYLVLQSMEADMAGKIKENLATIEPSDPELFKKIFDMLFNYAIEKTGDFEEVFSTNTVDKLPFTDQMLPSLKALVSYLSQIKWSEINVDVIGGIFEGLIYDERRHLLGQHYTDTKVVDLILTATLGKPGRILDPACGSGTFLVRALNYWRAKHLENTQILSLAKGIDIDKLASMLSKINLYIQGLEETTEKVQYPDIIQNDFFKIGFSPDFSYVTTNPPYTRQEEMAMAFYDKNYKDYLLKAVEDFPDWNKRASIYAYFLAKAGKILKEGGRLGFIVENSWLNAEYGHPLRQWFLDDLVLDYVIESIKERWFEDAKIITNIIVARKQKLKKHNIRFIYLKRPLEELIGNPPSVRDFTANQRYYEKIISLISGAKGAPSKNEKYAVSQDSKLRVVSVKKELLEKVEEIFGRWGIFRGPKEYLDMIIAFLQEETEGISLLSSVLDIRRGVTTNANEIFYLPSKHWQYLDEDDTHLTMKAPGYKSLKISKKYLNPLIIPTDIQGSPYKIEKRKKRRKSNHVIMVEDTSKVADVGMKDYLEWAKNFVNEEYETNERFSTIMKKIDSPKWPKLPDTSKGVFFFRKAPYKNFSIFLNALQDAQIDCEIYAGYLKKKYSDIDPRVIFSTLNSVLTYIGMELIGRASLGEGVLKTEVTDYNVIPIVDPQFLEKRLKEKSQFAGLLKTTDRLLTLKPLDIEDEAQRDLRIKMEEYVLGALGMKEEQILSLYGNLMDLVRIREERAESRQERLEATRKMRAR